ncbi:trigger factor [bacterium]|nr:trigger factor [bacterium]
MTKVALESVDAVRRRLAVEIPAAEVAAELERAYAQLKQRARVPGFRQGRAPRAVLEKMFGDQVRADVFGRLVQESYLDAVREQNLQPVSSPEIITESAEPGAPLRYSATIEVRPSVTATGYAGLAVERPVHAIADSDVDYFLTGLRERNATLVSISDRHETQAGDIATIDYEARVGDALVGRGDQRLVEVGGSAEEGPGAHLAGALLGVPVQFEIAYPAEHQNPDLAGKTVRFTATVTALARRDVPALDEAFAKAHGDVDTVDALRALVKQQLDVAAQRDAAAAVRSALVAKLVQAHEFDVPQSMIDRRAELLADEVLEGLGPRRPPASRAAEFRARLLHDLQEQARNQVKATLLLESIAAQEHLAVDDATIDAHIDRLAETAGKARERVRALYQDPGARAGLRSRLLQDRALDLLVARANITDVARPSGVAGVSGNG